MMRRFAVACGLTAILAGVMACGAARPSKFYTMDISETAATSSAPRIQTDLLVGRINAPHLYRDDRIVYRTGSTQLGTYEYHRWAEPPADTIEALLLRALRSSGNFRSVQSLRSNARGDYILRGRLNELNEISGGASGVAARVNLEVELYSQKSGTVVWSKLYSSDEPVNGKEVPAVVDALNKNVQRAMDQIVAGLADYFAKNPPPKE
ncbi:MAG: ABC-type transport auxiliary lipoprotein family protein [Acidobacteria bacterium]|nr:ABC-type transport auxiliary lipoprotein family protein [Acidobacteriota bacterium]MCL5287562.1 ABC-type transport auxiliary lipoprotein family protein [Acidobacteriota bacterium]